MASPRSAVILAGGGSLRFGSDKAFALHQGQPLIGIAIETLSRLSFQLHLSGSRETLGSMGFPVVEDQTPGQGPLSAVRDLLEATAVPKLLVVACDMPWITPEVAEALWQEGESHDLALLETETGLNPLPGVYGETCLETIRSLQRSGRNDLKALTETSLSLGSIPLPHLCAIDPELRSLRNINRKSDLGFSPRS